VELRHRDEKAVEAPLRLGDRGQVDLWGEAAIVVLVTLAASLDCVHFELGEAVLAWTGPASIPTRRAARHDAKDRRQSPVGLKQKLGVANSAQRVLLAIRLGVLHTTSTASATASRRGGGGSPAPRSHGAGG
jgi:hypothetical protein